MDQKSQKEEPPPPTPPPEIVTASQEASPQPTRPVDQKDVSLKYRSNQMKKLVHHIKSVQQAHGTENITELPNFEDLIKSALTQSKKSLPNESMFFNFLFRNGMASFVKNRSKIDLYYPEIWYQV